MSGEIAAAVESDDLAGEVGGVVVDGEQVAEPVKPARHLGGG